MLSYGQSVSRPPWENAGALSIPTEETHTENTALCGRHAARPAARGCHNNVTGRKPAANYTPPRIHGSLSRLVPHSGEFSPASSGGANNKPRRFCAGAFLYTKKPSGVFPRPASPIIFSLPFSRPAGISPTRWCRSPARSTGRFYRSASSCARWGFWWCRWTAA